MISAKIVADSIANGIRITTMELNYHRFIHSEFMTHRVFSRNAASTRAIPTAKFKELCTAVPIHWGKNQSGMVANEEFDEDDIAGFIDDWKDLTRKTIEVANYFSILGLHKQVVNRILEPFQWIKVIVTATEWDNFFDLRLHPDAQPEIQELARCMKEAMDASTPVSLLPGQWHLPYYYGSCTNEKGDPELDVAIKCSVARCARVSYLNHDNSSPDIEKDIALADRLLKAGHMSPFEHQATPMTQNIEDTWYTLEQGATHIDRNGDVWSNNFRGWIQNRALL